MRSYFISRWLWHCRLSPISQIRILNEYFLLPLLRRRPSLVHRFSPCSFLTLLWALDALHLQSAIVEHFRAIIELLQFSHRTRSCDGSWEWYTFIQARLFPKRLSMSVRLIFHLFLMTILRALFGSRLFYIPGFTCHSYHFLKLVQFFRQFLAMNFWNFVILGLRYELLAAGRFCVFCGWQSWFVKFWFFHVFNFNVHVDDAGGGLHLWVVGFVVTAVCSLGFLGVHFNCSISISSLKKEIFRLSLSSINSSKCSLKMPLSLLSRLLPQFDLQFLLFF